MRLAELPVPAAHLKRGDTFPARSGQRDGALEKIDRFAICKPPARLVSRTVQTRDRFCGNVGFRPVMREQRHVRGIVDFHPLREPPVQLAALRKNELLVSHLAHDRVLKLEELPCWIAERHRET